jgi:hypothetical protein
MPTRVAILVTFLGGWLLLPFERFEWVAQGMFAWWVTGLALPGDVLISKAWIAPVVALTGGILRDPPTIRHFRPAFIDIPIAVWCLWPFIDALVLGRANPGQIPAAAYLAGSWGVTWAIGRIWFSDAQGQRVLLGGLALAGCACLPFALLETWQGPFLHDLIYGPHPFRYDGSARYIFNRPLGFFEHGNQYGIWVSLCAVAAIWCAVDKGSRAPRSNLAAFFVSVLAIASQSIGAITLGVAAVTAIMFWSKRVVRYGAVFVIAMVIAASAVQLSGVIPVRSFIEQTKAGQETLAMIRATGRGSFAWRVSQDLKTMDAVRAAPVMGTGQWDWWRRYGTRPWGLWMLIAGQYGIAGLALAYGSLLLAAARVLISSSYPVKASAATGLAMITIAALGDTMLNAFLFFPAILAAGAIVVKGPGIENGDCGDDCS